MSRGSAGAARSLNRSLRAAADLWSILLASKWRVLASTVVCTLIAIAIAYALPEKFRAETLLKPARAQNNIMSKLGLAGGLASLAGLNLPVEDRSAEAQAFLESKEFSMEFVRTEHLLPVLFASKFDASAG